MGIHRNLRDLCIDCWCDGCGEVMKVPSMNWFDGKDAIENEGWFTRGIDYGDPRGLAWEHFCSKDCLDDDDPHPRWRFLIRSMVRRQPAT